MLLVRERGLAHLGGFIEGLNMGLSGWGGCGWGCLLCGWGHSQPHKSPVRGAPSEAHGSVLWALCGSWEKAEEGNQLWRWSETCGSRRGGLRCPCPQRHSVGRDGCAMAAGGTVGLGMARRLPRSWGPPAAAQLLGLSAAFQVQCGCDTAMPCQVGRSRQ